MPYLPAAHRTWLEDRLAALVHPLHLHLFTQGVDCERCDEARGIVSDLASLSRHIACHEHDLVLAREHASAFGFDRAPGLAVTGDQDYGVRFLGAPLGHELDALVEAMTTVSRRDSGLSAGSRARLAALTVPVSIQVFSTPSCVHCPRAVSLAHRLAVESPLITATGVSIVEFPDLIRRYRVNGVPKIVIGHQVELLGPPLESDLVDAVVRASDRASDHS
jgi:glutaredoxin-like protein